MKRGNTILQALMAPAIPPRHGFYDEVMKKEMHFSLGFLIPCPTYPFSNPGAFGEPVVRLGMPTHRRV